MQQLKLVLPPSPSINHYWLQRWGHGRYISKRGCEYRAAVLLACKGVKMSFEGSVELEIVLYPPNKRFIDLDNCLKALLDSLEHAGIYKNDKQIDKITIERGPIKPPGEMHVIVRDLVR